MFVPESATWGLEYFAVMAMATIICAFAIPIGNLLCVMDKPSLPRKRHATPTPQVGGLAIMVPLQIWLIYGMVMGTVTAPGFVAAVLLCGSVVAIIGYIDDQTSISPSSRILLLIVMMATAFLLDPSLVAHTLNWNSFEPTHIPVLAYYVLVAIAAIGVVNAVNMADGQNGVVCGMFVIWSACLIAISGPQIAAIASVIMAAALVVLVFNLRGKLFLGDCGTYGVTFVLGLLTARAHAKGYVSLEVICVWFFIPVMDTLRLIITRLLEGRSPLEGDRDHFHHRLEDKMGKNMGLFTYLSVVGVTSSVATYDPRFSLVCLIVLAAIYFSFAWLTDTASRVAANDAEPLPDIFPGVSMGKGEMNTALPRARSADTLKSG